MVNLGFYINTESGKQSASQQVSISVTKTFLPDRLAHMDVGDIVEQFVEFLDQTGIEYSDVVRDFLLDCSLAAGSSQVGKDVRERLQMWRDQL